MKLAQNQRLLSSDASISDGQDTLEMMPQEPSTSKVHSINVSAQVFLTK